VHAQRAYREMRSRGLCGTSTQAQATLEHENALSRPQPVGVQAVVRDRAPFSSSPSPSLPRPSFLFIPPSPSLDPSLSSLIPFRAPFLELRVTTSSAEEQRGSAHHPERQLAARAHKHLRRPR